MTIDRDQVEFLSLRVGPPDDARVHFLVRRSTLKNLETLKQASQHAGRARYIARASCTYITRHVHKRAIKSWSKFVPPPLNIKFFIDGHQAQARQMSVLLAARDLIAHLTLSADAVDRAASSIQLIEHIGYFSMHGQTYCYCSTNETLYIFLRSGAWEIAVKRKEVFGRLDQNT